MTSGFKDLGLGIDLYAFTSNASVKRKLVLFASAVDVVINQSIQTKAQLFESTLPSQNYPSKP